MFAGILQDDDQATNLYPGISASVKGILNYYGSVSVMLEDSNPLPSIIICRTALRAWKWGE